MHKPCDYHLIYSTLPGPGPMVEDQYPSVGAGSEKDFHGMVLVGQVASVTDDAEHLKLLAETHRDKMQYQTYHSGTNKRRRHHARISVMCTCSDILGVVLKARPELQKRRWGSWSD
ncbi:hypothetical protein PGQ11_006130 [Apiospora arundinis]|uniref:YCII-related domain-containing protein n=1 Tax=Apiospora arundinis TaxID=335852 RepID=A0ABR2ISG1_9PEZI